MKLQDAKEALHLVEVNLFVIQSEITVCDFKAAEERTILLIKSAQKLKQILEKDDSERPAN